MIEYGLTFTQTYAGRNDRSKQIAAAVSRVGGRIGKRIRSRLICDPPRSGFEWDQLVPTQRALNKAGHDVTISICDSLAMPYYCDPNTGQGVAAYTGRTEVAVKTYSPGSPTTDYEIVNEWGGDWLGDEDRVAQCAEAARAVVHKAGRRAIAGIFFSFLDMGARMLETVRRHPIRADRYLVSIYPWEIRELYENPELIPSFVDWKDVFERLNALVPWAELGFSEFGPQPRRSTIEKRRELVRAVHSIRPAAGSDSPAAKKFVGLWHYWQAYNDLVGKPGKGGVEDAVCESWT